jgi:hypothetical protein
MKRLIFIWFVLACCGKNEDRRYELLSKFLKEDLKLDSIDFTKKNKIILVPESGCLGCISNVATQISKLCKQEKLPDDVWIVYSSAKYKKVFKRCSTKAIYDSMSYLADLRVRVINISGYEIQNGAILREAFALTEEPEKFMEFILD